MASNLHVKKGDKVEIISGKDKKKTGKVLVEVDPKYFRPAEVELLWGDATKAEKELEWERKVNFRDLVSMMVDSDMREIAGIGSQEFIAKQEIAATK